MPSLKTPTDSIKGKGFKGKGSSSHLAKGKNKGMVRTPLKDLKK